MIRATEHAEENLARHNSLEGWTTIIQSQYPTIFEAFEMISHDAGFGAGHANYSIPPEYTAEKLIAIEASLKTMEPLDLQDFCIGEESNPGPELCDADAFLTHFFNDWEIEE